MAGRGLATFLTYLVSICTGTSVGFAARQRGLVPGNGPADLFPTGSMFHRPGPGRVDVPSTRFRPAAADCSFAGKVGAKYDADLRVHDRPGQ